jgi:hypothetical protein
MSGKNDKMIETAFNFLLGEGPFVTIISAFLPDLTVEQNLLRHALLKKRAEDFDGLILFELAGSWNYNDFVSMPEKSIAVSGLTSGQALILTREFGQKAHLYKDWGGEVHLRFSDFEDKVNNKTYKPTKLLGLRIIDDPFSDGNKILNFRYNFAD